MGGSGGSQHWLKDQREWAKRKRRELIEILGGKCEICHTTEKLEVDHVDGRDYELAKISQDQRIIRYMREYREGKRLRVLCKSHNANAGKEFDRAF